MTSIDVEELSDENERRNDFRRANGSPLVSDPNDPNKTLRYRRPSGYGKNLDDENALVNWRIWRSMLGVAKSRSLAAEVNATKDEDRAAKQVLREKAMDKGSANEAADMGTALHAMTARVEDDDDDFEPPPQYIADLDAFQATLAAYGLVSAYTEVHMVNDTYRAAGTADRIFRLTRALASPAGDVPAGTLVLGDIKTGKSLDFSAPGFNVQTALYATGVFYDIVTERRVETPPIDPNWTILIHLPVGRASCTLHWCKVETGLYGAWLSAEVKEWQRRWKNGTYDIERVELPKTGPELAVEAVGAIDADLIPVMVEFCKRRVLRIGALPARADLLTAWGDLPKLTEIATAFDIVRLLNILDTVEAKHSLPFLTDPRTERQRGTNKRAVDRSNEFALVDGIRNRNDRYGATSPAGDDTDPVNHQ